MVDLICLAGAGAGASAFRGWASQIPPFAALLSAQLPGREGRIGEPPVESIGEAAQALTSALLARPPRPSAIFGHSMGAVIAFKVARNLADAGRPPGAVVLTASAPPTGQGMVVRQEDLEALMLAYDPSNARITRDAELFATLGPVLAADIAMLRRHRVDGAPLRAPVHLLMGADDAVVAPAKGDAWRPHLAGPVEAQVLPGGHFFVFREAQTVVMTLLSRLLTDLARD